MMMMMMIWFIKSAEFLRCFTHEINSKADRPAQSVVTY